MKILFVLSLFSLVVSAAEFRVGASTTGKTNVFNKVDKAFEQKTGIKITYVGDNSKHDSVDMFKMMMDGTADACTSTTPYEEFRKQLTERNVVGPDLNKVTNRVIGRDLMNVYANKGNGITTLTHEELKGIFTGKIKNWKEVKGADLPVKIAIQEGRQATVKTFERLINKKEKIAGNVTKVDHHDDVIEFVAKTKGGVGFGPAEKKSDKVTMVQTEPIGRPVYLFTIGKPTPEAEKFLQFLSEEGSKHGIGR